MKNLENVRVLVVGDIMLDKYVVGDVTRISPEAPVPIVNVSDEYHTLGGCGNVVNNIREVGAEVDCLAPIAFDLNGQIIANELKNIGAGNLLFHGCERTIVKERIISDQRHVQMLRIDYETIKQVDTKLSIEMLDKLETINYDVIIVSDYAKGMITAQLMTYLKSMNIKIIVDPKPANGNIYNGVYMITPNESEWQQMFLTSAYCLDSVDYFLVTKGKKGMTLMKNLDMDQRWDIESESVPIYNVSGAGDTVVAIMSVCLSMGWNELDSAYIANKCAGYVVTQPGTSVVPKNKFMNIIQEYKNGGTDV